MSILTYDEKSFYLDGEPFRLIAGDIHYYRIHEKDWERNLDLAVDFGLNTIQTYVAWNAHEPKEGKFDFSGMLDLGAFLNLCAKKDLKVLLRPSPFICGEWDLGGHPAWLLKHHDISLRSSDPRYLEALQNYYDRLIPEFLPYLSTNGGPIIAVAVENEYGGYGNDHKYINAIADMLRDGGVDVPLYTTDGDPDHMLTFGRMKSPALFGVNFRATEGRSEAAKKMYAKYAKDQPFFISEFWGGRSMHWGESFYHRAPEDTAIAFKEALELGGHVCFYMFAGGTNFGFMGGANYGLPYSPRPGTAKRYIPLATSYDVDALVSEGGKPTKKYFLCRDVLDEFLGNKKRPHTYKAHPAQAITVKITETADLYENIDNLTERKVESLVPKTMELYDQNYGLINYTTSIDGFEDNPYPLHPYRYLDRANLYVDDTWFATFLRDRGTTKVASGVDVVDGLPMFKQNGIEHKIDILVENVGRINHRTPMNYERKGLDDCIHYAGVKLYNYVTRTIPLNNLSSLIWKAEQPNDHRPCFFKGNFDAECGVDTYVKFEGFDHGYVWINGFNVGRYDGVGPQLTLYVPGHLLNSQNNEIVILDIDPKGEHSEINLLDHEILEGESEELS